MIQRIRDTGTRAQKQIVPSETRSYLRSPGEPKSVVSDSFKHRVELLEFLWKLLRDGEKNVNLAILELAIKHMGLFQICSCKFIDYFGENYNINVLMRTASIPAPAKAQLITGEQIAWRR